MSAPFEHEIDDRLRRRCAKRRCRNRRARADRDVARSASPIMRPPCARGVHAVAPPADRSQALQRQRLLPLRSPCGSESGCRGRCGAGTWFRGRARPVGGAKRSSRPIRIRRSRERSCGLADGVARCLCARPASANAIVSTKPRCSKSAPRSPSYVPRL